MVSDQQQGVRALAAGDLHGCSAKPYKDIIGVFPLRRSWLNRFWPILYAHMNWLLSGFELPSSFFDSLHAWILVVGS